MAGYVLAIFCNKVFKSKPQKNIKDSSFFSDVNTTKPKICTNHNKTNQRSTIAVKYPCMANTVSLFQNLKAVLNQFELNNETIAFCRAALQLKLYLFHNC